MVKLIKGKLPRELFDFLGIKRSAVLSSYTSLFCEDYSDNEIYLQYSSEQISSAFANFADKSLLFVSKDTDYDELKFALNSNLLSTDILPFKKYGSLFLLSCDSNGENEESEFDISDIPLNLILDDERVIEKKKYLYIKGKCRPFALTKDEIVCAFGLLSISDDYNIISDIYTRPKFRRKGYASEIIYNLLSMAPAGKIYTICEEELLSLYLSIGFSPCGEINKYII